MLIKVQIFTHLISRGLGCFILIGVGWGREGEQQDDGEKKTKMEKEGLVSMVNLNMALRWWEGIVSYCTQMNFSLPLFLCQEGKSSVTEIRLSFAHECFHLDHEVIVLIHYIRGLRTKKRPAPIPICRILGRYWVFGGGEEGSLLNYFH